MLWVNDSFGTRAGSWCLDSKREVACWDKTHNLRQLQRRVKLRLRSIRFFINPDCFHLGVGFAAEAICQILRLNDKFGPEADIHQ